MLFCEVIYVKLNTLLYRVFGNEGHPESGSNLINFLPEILPKAF